MEWLPKDLSWLPEWGREERSTQAKLLQMVRTFIVREEVVVRDGGPLAMLRSFWEKQAPTLRMKAAAFLSSFWDRKGQELLSSRILTRVSAHFDLDLLNSIYGGVEKIQTFQPHPAPLDAILSLLMGIALGIGLMYFWVYCSRLRSEERQKKISSTIALSTMNRDDLLKFFPDNQVPRWIVMGKYEKVPWINHCVRKLWPLYSAIESKVLRELWEPWINFYRPLAVSRLSFARFDLGSIPPVILGVRVASSTEEEVVMDAECQWQGNPRVVVRVGTPLGLNLPFELTNVTMLVVIRLVFRPLVDQLPGFGAFSFSIRKNKRFDFQTKLVHGDVASIPTLGTIVEDMIKSSILDMLMWPMRIPVPVIPSPVDYDYSSRLQRHFNPRRGAVLFSDYGILEEQAVGILDIRLVQAKDLRTKNPGEKFSSYVFLYIKSIPRLMKRSETIKEKLFPIWNEMYELEVEDPTTQKLVVKIIDADADVDNEIAGCCQVYLKDLEPDAVTEMWIRLVKDHENPSPKYRGEVNLEVVYRPFGQISSHNASATPSSPATSDAESTASTSASPPPRALSLFAEDIRTRAGGEANVVHPIFSHRGPLWEIVRGFLEVTVERAEDLAFKESWGSSDPYVVLKIRSTKLKKQTKVLYKTLIPVWNETLDFALEDGNHDILKIKVWERQTCGKGFLGRYATTLTKAIQNGTHEEAYDLYGVPSGKIFLKMRWSNQPFKTLGQRRVGFFI